MKRFLLLILLTPWSAFSQSVISLNTKYQYDPLNEVFLEIKPVKLSTDFIVYFELKRNRADVIPYEISFEKRDYYSQKSGSPIEEVSYTDSSKTQGYLRFPLPEKPWLLLATVSDEESGGSWNYYTLIDPKYPVNGNLERDGKPILSSYVAADNDYIFHGSGSGKELHVFYYRTAFPAGSPAFAEKEAKVDRILQADSTFTVAPETFIKINSEGLYLVQEDTSSAEGWAFRAVSSSYPAYTKLQELTDPLIFITTVDEHELLVQAKDDKAKFDKVILDITGNKERAKNFMRTYFNRVKLANQYFTSYKEGWRTDRGMMYMIFGLPDEVNRNENTEIWNYKNLDARFTFVRSGSVYDPNAYVLLRDKRFTEKWYYTIDLWRKSRF